MFINKTDPFLTHYYCRQRYEVLDGYQMVYDGYSFSIHNKWRAIVAFERCCFDSLTPLRPEQILMDFHYLRYLQEAFETGTKKLARPLAYHTKDLIK